LTFETIRTLLQTPYTTEVGEKIKAYDDLISDVLWGRTYGDPDERDDSESEFDERIKKDMTAFCGSVCGNDAGNKMTVFVGHCQQHLVHQEPAERSTLSHLCKRTKLIEAYDNTEIYTGLPDASNLYDRTNKTFGIVTEGYHNKIKDKYIPVLVKLDVGVGRGQEYTEDYEKLKKGSLSEIDFFRPRAPTVFKIVGNNMEIIRSTLSNMAMHMKREAYMEYKPSPSIYDTPGFRKTKKK
jgi:hypothetical protein